MHDSSYPHVCMLYNTIYCCMRLFHSNMHMSDSTHALNVTMHTYLALKFVAIAAVVKVICVRARSARLYYFAKNIECYR